MQVSLPVSKDGAPLAYNMRDPSVSFYSLPVHTKESLPLKTGLLIARPRVFRSFSYALKSLSFSVVCTRMLYTRNS
jgi:hypothetical protein